MHEEKNNSNPAKICGSKFNLRLKLTLPTFDSVITLNPCEIVKYKYILYNPTKNTYLKMKHLLTGKKLIKLENISTSPNNDKNGGTEAFLQHNINNIKTNKGDIFIALGVFNKLRDPTFL